MHTIFMALRQYFRGTYHVSAHEGYINYYNKFSVYSSGGVDNSLTIIVCLSVL